MGVIDIKSFLNKMNIDPTKRSEATDILSKLNKESEDSKLSSGFKPSNFNALNPTNVREDQVGLGSLIGGIVDLFKQQKNDNGKGNKGFGEKLLSQVGKIAGSQFDLAKKENEGLMETVNKNMGTTGQLAEDIRGSLN